MVNIRVIGILHFPSHRKILLHLNCLALAQALVSGGFDTEEQKLFKKKRKKSQQICLLLKPGLLVYCISIASVKRAMTPLVILPLLGHQREVAM